MNNNRGVAPWLVLALVGAWCASLQGWSGARFLGGWTPDLLLVLYFAIAPRLDGDGLRFTAIFVALARAAFSVDPPVAIFAGYLGVAGLYAAVRATLDVESVAARAVLAAAASVGLSSWLHVVHAARTDIVLASSTSAGQLALATALATVVFAPLFARLPFLRQLDTRRR